MKYLDQQSKEKENLLGLLLYLLDLENVIFLCWFGVEYETPSGIKKCACDSIMLLIKSLKILGQNINHMKKL